MKKNTCNFCYFLRNIRSKKLFSVLNKYCNGNILDIGGADFYRYVKKEKIKYNSWTCLEKDKNYRSNIKDKNFNFILGDGCKMPFRSNSFDTILNIQVLEHVIEPLVMVKEIARVLKPGGYAIILLPQTSTLHMLPSHYYNFTRYWIIEAAKKNKLKIIELTPIGGYWSSSASRSVYFFLECLRFPGMSSKIFKRNIFFYLLLPFMFAYSMTNIIISMIFSIGDMEEEPNNHLAVVKK